MTASRRRPWLAEALVILALLLLPLLFWWRLWALDPADRAVIPEGDFTSQYYPLQLFAAQELANGRLPAWDPYINAGQPGLADIQSGAFYPLNLLPNLVLAWWGVPFSLGLLEAQVILHFSLASLFTYLLVRRLARRAGARTAAARFAGAVAAMTFTYAGYLTSFPVQQITILETAVWLPLILLLLDMAIERGPGADSAAPPSTAAVASTGGERLRISWALPLAGIAFACSLLAGHPQTAMYVAYAALAYGAFRVASVAAPVEAAPRPGQADQTPGEAQDLPPLTSQGSRLTFYLARFGLYVLLPLVLGAALAAVQLVPTLAFIARSTRSGLDYDAVAGGFALAEITHLLYPGYFGGSPQYMGILPLVLVAAALFVRRARREVAFWMALGGVAFVLALGGNTFLYSVAYLLVPGFGAVRDQERIVYLFSFAVSVLAGLGALVLVRRLPGRRRAGFRRFVRGIGRVWVLFLALTAVWYYGYLQGLQQKVDVNLFEGVLRHHALLLLILGGSAVLFALRSTKRVRRRGLAALALGLIALNLFTVNWRYNLAEPAAGGAFPVTGLVKFLQEQPGTFRISSAGLLPGGASAGIVYGLEDITANTPLRLEGFQRLEDQVGSWRRWQLLNVQYVLSEEDLDGPGLERAYEEGQVKAYRLSDALPRAWVVHQAVVANDDQAIAVLNAGDFDPSATAVLPDGSQIPSLTGTSGSGDAGQVVEAVPGRLVVDVAPSADGLLVVSQPFYPGWQARVDGQRTPLRRVDSFLQGLPISAGPHRVELTYHLSFWPAAVSLAALVGCLAALALRRTLH